jgi:hypothetical protein
MRVTRAQLLPLLLLLACMFGCKAGQVLRVVGVVALTTVRVAALAAAASNHNHHVEPGSEPSTAESVEAQRRVEEGANRPGQCTELFVDTLPPGAPGNTAPARAADCGGHVIIQDEEGHWRSYGPNAVPAIQEP